MAKRVRVTFANLTDWTAAQPVFIDGHSATLYLYASGFKMNALIGGKFVTPQTGWAEGPAFQQAATIDFPLQVVDGNAVRYAERLSFSFSGVALLVQRYIEDAPNAEFD